MVGQHEQRHCGLRSRRSPGWHRLGALAVLLASPVFSQITNVPGGSLTSSSQVINLFTGCSGTQYLGADGACHTASGSGSVTSVGLVGTANQLTVTGTSPITTAGSWTLSIPSTFTFPGVVNFHSGGTAEPAFNVPTSAAPTSPASGDFWNLSGVLQMNDGSSTHSLMYRDTVLASGQMPTFTGDVTNSGLAMTVAKLNASTACDTFEAHGAVGNGVTDDHVAVQAALTGLPTTSGCIRMTTGAVYYLGSTGVTVAGTKQNYRIFSDGGGASGTVGAMFKYCGTGTALALGDSSNKTVNASLENFGIYLPVTACAGASAIGLSATQTDSLKISRIYVASDKGGTINSQTAIKLDGGTTGHFSAYTLIEQPMIAGDFATGILVTATDAAANNRSQIIGGYVGGTSSGPGAGGIGVDIESSDTWQIHGTDLTGWATGLKVATNTNGPLSPACELNTVNINVSGNSNTFITDCTITDSGSNNVKIVAGNGGTNSQVLPNIVGTAVQLGVNATTAGTLGIANANSTGVTVTIQNPSANAGSGGAYNFNLPAQAGNSGQPLLSGGGGSSPHTYGTLLPPAGGTGVTTAASHGVAVGQGTSAFNFPVPSGNGQCFMSDPSAGTTTDPSFQSCPGAGSVTGSATTGQGTFWSGSSALSGSSKWTYSASSGHSVTQGATGADAFYSIRASDSTLTGNFLHFQNNAANADLFKVDVTGAITTPATTNIFGSGTSSVGSIQFFQGSAPAGVSSNSTIAGVSTGSGFQISNGSGSNLPVVAGPASSVAKQLVQFSGTDASLTASVDFPDVKIIPLANCNNATAGAGADLPATNAPTVACRAGTNNLGGVLQWANNNTTTNAQFSFELPNDWDTATQPYINIYYGSGANTSGTVKWTFSSACTKADGSVTDDPAFNAESASAGRTMAVANRMWAESVQFTALTSGNNCVAGSNVVVKITSGNGTATSTVNVSKVVLTIPRLLTVQAN